MVRFGGFFNRQRKDRELDDEIESHLQMHIEDNLRSGMTPEEALRYAMQWGRGLDEKLAERFVGMYVNEDTLTQGNEVQKGLRTLYNEAFERGLLPARPALKFI